MLDLQNIVFSRIKNSYTKPLKTKYPNTFFTTSDRVAKDPKFPTVYIHEMYSEERGQDLENLTINAVLSTFQIEVYDNESMGNCSDVMDYVVSVMKSMRFSIVAMPEFKNTSDVYRKVARFKRMVGSGDTL